MHRAYVQVLAWNGRALSDAEELLRQAMNALGTVDKNEPGQPIADNGMTVWDGMRLESDRLWKLYRERSDPGTARNTRTEAPQQ